MSSELFYFGTQDEVEIGDRVRIKRWLRSDQCGIVCHIPGVSPPHPSLEYDDVKKWAIRLDDGTILAMGYEPGNKYGQPDKHLVLVVRGEGGNLDTEEELQ